jgi:hypothetical protein
MEQSMADPKPRRAGYKRPPAEHQFVPGVSGNPAGRPRGRRNFLSELADELNEIVPGEGTTKQRALIKNLVGDALEGKGRALAIVFALVPRLSSVSTEEEDAPEDAAIAESFSRTRSGDVA